jgi:putative hemolysin
MNEFLYIIAIAGLMIIAGFFNGVETGFYLMNAARVRLMSLRGSVHARSLSRMLDKPGYLLATLLVGVNIAVFLSANLATTLVNGWFPNMEPFEKVLITTIMLDPLILVFAEMLPKNLYRRRANTLMAASSRPLLLSYFIFLPVSFILSGFGRVVSLALGRGQPMREDFWTLRNIEHHLTEAVEHGALSPRQNIIAGNILGLGRVKVFSVMTPLKSAALVSSDVFFKDCFALAAKRRYSRYPVYSGSQSNVVGTVNIFSPLFETGKSREEIAAMPIKDYVKKHVAVPENMEVDKALALLRENQTPMGIVKSAKGDAVGLVTTKDLVEEVTGELPVW